MRNSFAPDGSVAREDEANDCLTDRQAVLDEQVNVVHTRMLNFFKCITIFIFHVDY